MIVRETLPNGLTLVTEAIPTCAAWRRGSGCAAAAVTSRSSSPDQSLHRAHGLQGTRHRTREQIASEVTRWGANGRLHGEGYASFNLKVLDAHAAGGGWTSWATW